MLTGDKREDDIQTAERLTTMILNLINGSDHNNKTIAVLQTSLLAVANRIKTREQGTTA